MNQNTAPTNPGVPAFWIDASPSSSLPADQGANGGYGYGAEDSFQLFYSGSSVQVGFTGAAPSLTLPNSGWYVFQFEYSKGATPTSLVNVTLDVLQGSTVLGTKTFLADDSTGNALESQYLGGPGYIWLPVWQNGFSNDTLGIDNVRADTVGVPEPATWAMLIFGLAAIGGTMRSRRRSLATA